jgi:cyclic-di-AMP phosphodiesterase
LNSRKPPKFAEPGVRMCLLLMVIFAAVTYFVNHDLAYAEGIITVLLAVFVFIRARKRRREMQTFVESAAYTTESATSSTLMHFPLPMAVFRLNDTGVVWGNQAFWEMCGRSHSAYEARITTYVPEFNSKWLLEGKTRMAEVLEVRGHRYEVNGNMVRAGEHEETFEFMGISYWLDVTEYEDIKEKYLATRPVVMIILVDNYDEMMKPLTDRQRTELRSQLDLGVEKWCEGRGGILRRVDRDRYIFIFEKQHLDDITKNRFTLIESMHSIVNLTGIHATVSIGVGLDGAGYEEDYSFASLAEDMALSRGGDQAVVKNKFNFEFYGGRGTEVETRTKVKSRVMANSLSRLIQDASQVFVMGHRYADIDAVGAAVGICCIARRYGCTARIVLDEDKNAVASLLAELQKEEEYKNAFLSPEEALLEADSRTLLVVVDTNRPEQVEDDSLLTACSSRLAVIDHHRRAATYIQNATLALYEPNASSTCELVTELMQELIEPKDILPVEADAVLAGIVLDTKNFTIRTCDRTFDAAAYLRRFGADTTRVKLLFQNGLEETMERYDIMKHAQIYKGIAVAAAEETQNRIIAAQAADELLNISGVTASAVLYPTDDGGVSISARSIGDVNVQVLLESLGGGGNHSAAGAQLHDITAHDAVTKLYAAIDQYFATD